MITNEQQYKITKSEAGKFEAAIAALLAQEPAAESDDDLFRRLQVDAMQSQLADLRTELAEYEALKTGQRPLLELDSFDKLPRALIAARIAAGMTQCDLADRLGVHERQSQRYEASNYASAGLQRIDEVIDALGVAIRAAVELASSAVAAGGRISRSATDPIALPKRVASDQSG
jgi:transcriptional regulator with XRE-family HTH domain